MMVTALRRRGLARPGRSRSLRPTLEGLESRLLLAFSTTGGQWFFGDRITYSIVPDGTEIVVNSQGQTVTSNLQATLDALYSRATWEQQFMKAAAEWQRNAQINLARVADNGAKIGTPGNWQNDPRFGDIRIAGYSMAGGGLAYAFLAPPLNDGTEAGDIMMNTSANWRISTNNQSINGVDLMSVALHELGHSLGLGHSDPSAGAQPVMYHSYQGVKQLLHSVDIAGIQHLYGVRQPDYFDATANPNNNHQNRASNLNPYLDANHRIALPNPSLFPEIPYLDLTPSDPATGSGADTDWYRVTVPSSTNGLMVIRMHSWNLSSLSPRVQIFSSSGQILAEALAPQSYGGTVTIVGSGVQAGQTYLIRAIAANNGPDAYGSYGLIINFNGSNPGFISPPNTTVAGFSKPYSGGGQSMPQSEGTLGTVESIDAQPSSLPWYRIASDSEWGQQVIVFQDLSGRPGLALGTSPLGPGGVGSSPWWASPGNQLAFGVVPGFALGSPALDALDHVLSIWKKG